MNDQINKPHDNVVKNILGREGNAKDFVRYYLPQEITKDLDLETLEVSSQSYVSDHLKGQGKQDPPSNCYPPGLLPWQKALETLS